MPVPSRSPRRGAPRPPRGALSLPLDAAIPPESPHPLITSHTTVRVGLITESPIATRDAIWQDRPHVSPESVRSEGARFAPTTTCPPVPSRPLDSSYPPSSLYDCAFLYDVASLYDGRFPYDTQDPSRGPRSAPARTRPAVRHPDPGGDPVTSADGQRSDGSGQTPRQDPWADDEEPGRPGFRNPLLFALITALAIVVGCCCFGFGCGVANDLYEIVR